MVKWLVTSTNPLPTETSEQQMNVKPFIIRCEVALPSPSIFYINKRADENLFKSVSGEIP